MQTTTTLSASDILMPMPVPMRRMGGSECQQYLRQLGYIAGSPSPSDSRAPPSLLSRLTIVRCPPSADRSEDDNAAARGNTVRATLARSQSERISSRSAGNLGQVSFAKASFASPEPGACTRRSSFPSIPSPKRTLTPEEVVTAARQSCSRPSRTVSRSRSAVAISENGSPSFTPVTDSSILLPFLDRPAEVTELLASTKNAKLVAFLHRLLPAPSHIPNSVGASVSSKQWSNKDLFHWLKDVDRSEADDRAWVLALRDAINPRSEIVWEHVESMLGVPADLDASLDSDGVERRGSIPSGFYVEALEAVSTLADVQEDAEEAAGSKDDDMYGIRITTPICTPTPQEQTTAPHRSLSTYPARPSVETLRTKSLSNMRTPTMRPSIDTPLFPVSFAKMTDRGIAVQ